MNHGSGRLDRRFCTASEGITAHTWEGNDFWVYKTERKRKIKYNTSQIDTASRLPHSLTWPLVPLEVSPSWLQPPSLWFTSTRIPPQSSGDGIQSALPRAAQSRWYAHTNACKHTHACTRATRTRRPRFSSTHFFPFPLDTQAALMLFLMQEWVLVSDV